MIKHMERNDVSAQLRRLRRRLGLSLTDLARRAGTSATALSRYENGWGRFELYTLRKIATALGCRLRIEFEPLRGCEEVPSKAAAVRRLSRLFWDRDLREADLDDHAQWVVARVLEYGTLADVNALSSILGRKRFLGEVARARFESRRTENFWRLVLEREGVRCTRRYSRKEARSCWHG